MREVIGICIPNAAMVEQKFTKDAASESRSSSESEVVFPSFYVPKAIEIWPGAAEAPESLRRFWPEAARKRTAGPLFLARRSTWRIALVEFGNSIRIAWVASFWTCFIEVHLAAPKSCELHRVFYSSVRCPIVGGCNLQLQRAANCNDISTHRRCPIADIRSSNECGR